MSSLRVLVVEDDDTIREVLSARISDWGYRPRTAATKEAAAELLQSFDPDIVVTDLVLPDGSALDLPGLMENSPNGRRRAVFVITGHGTIDVAVEAMKKGAKDFLTKPLNTDKLRALMDEAVDELEIRGRIRQLDSELDSGAGLPPLVGRSEPMLQIFDTIRTVASKGVASAIISGESGTGKELVARAIHDLSPRASGPYVALNAAAVPEGLIESELFGHVKGAFTGAMRAREGCFEQADGGTLLLDEIGEMPLELQPSLLRILEEGRARPVGGDREVEFDVRVLAATNQDVEKTLEEGRLREDLYYRLNVFQIHLPPLRDRRTDIPLLVQHFIRTFNEKHETEVEGCADEALELLQRYEWPGNVRELRNVVERAVVIVGNGLLREHHLPPYLRDDQLNPSSDEMGIFVGMSAAEAEKRLILRTLRHTGGNKTEAARKLGLTPKTIRNKLKRWDVDVADIVKGDESRT